MLKQIFSYLFPAVVSLYPAVPAGTNIYSQGNSLEENGGMLNIGSVVGALNALATNAAPNSGSTNANTNSGATVTLTNLANLTQVLTQAGAVTVTIDSAYNIVNQIPGPFNGMTFPMQIVAVGATTVATPTVTSTGVTLAGTTSVVANSVRYYSGQITQLYAGTSQIQPLTAGTTFTSLAQSGSTNKYTLTIAGNSITTTVGNIIYLNVTTGTLPPGWYPIVSASSTAPLIVAPTQATAWTCTAVSTMTQPTSASNVYAPLITLTGLYSVNAALSTITA
jgi:hypothetical protein